MTRKSSSIVLRTLLRFSVFESKFEVEQFEIRDICFLLPQDGLSIALKKLSSKSHARRLISRINLSRLEIWKNLTCTMRSCSASLGSYILAHKPRFEQISRSRW
jgi:hypothetical protein